MPQKAARTAIAALAAEAGIDADAPSLDEAESAARVTRRRSRKRQAPVPTTKPMEQMLWDAACSIRGEKDAAKFKDYLLPLLFLKRLSDVFDDEIDRLAEEYGDRAVAQEIAESGPRPAALLPAPGGPLGRSQRTRGSRVVPSTARDAASDPRDMGEHLTTGGALRSCGGTRPSPASSTWWISPPSATASGTSTRPGSPPWWKLSRIPRYRLGLADVQPDFLGPRLRVPSPQVRRGLRAERGRVLYPHRGRLPHGPYHAAQARRDSVTTTPAARPGLLIKLQLVARETDPTSKRAPQALRAGVAGRQLRRPPT